MLSVTYIVLPDLGTTSNVTSFVLSIDNVFILLSIIEIGLSLTCVHTIQL